MARKVAIDIVATNKASKAFKDVASDADKMGKAVDTSAKTSAKSFGDFNTAITLAATAVGVGLAASVKSASDLAESINKSSVVFGENADEIAKWSESTAEDLGISKREALETAATFGNLFDSMGLLPDASAEMSVGLVELAADLASFNNIGTDVALEKLRAGLVGEIEPLRTLGVNLSEAAVQAELLRQGAEKVNGEFTAADKVQARYALIMAQTSNAQGDFARTSDELANSSRIARAELANASAELGTALIPAVTTAAHVVGDLAHAFTALPDSVQSGIVLTTGSLAALTVSVAAVTKVVATLGPVVSVLGSAAGTAAAGAGLGGLASGLLLVGGAAAALAAPIGIATYLVVTQDDVMREATETTLNNTEALQGYITYLNTLNVSAAEVDNLSDAMHELLDWTVKTSAAASEVLIDPNLNVIGDEFVTTIGSLNDELLRMDPANLQQVLDFMTQLGIVTTDPSTWNPENIQLLGEYIYLLSQQENILTSETYELERANALNNRTMTTTTEAMHEATEASAALTNQMISLANELNQGVVQQAANSYDSIVGFTDGLVGAIEKSEEWATSLIGPIGAFSELEVMLEDHQISVTEYIEAKQAQVDITDALNRATEASNIIQATQAETVAAGADATADYLERLAALPEAEQALRLAWADTDIAGRANEIRDLSQEFGNMDAQSQQAFGNMVTSAAAVDPQLALVLQDMGLIKASVEDPSGWTVVTDTTDAESDMDRLTAAIQELTTAITGVPDVDVTASLDTTGFWDAYLALPDSKAINIYTRNDYGPSPDVAIGGPVRFASGGVARLAEIGPEMLRFPSGNIGMAMTDGLYAIPNGTQVDTAAATRDKLGGGLGRKTGMFAGATVNINVYPSTPDVHDAIAQQFLAGGL
jgi:hypothetical protein